jgi:hypothetical protein
MRVQEIMSNVPDGSRSSRDFRIGRNEESEEIPKRSFMNKRREK